MTQQFQSWIYVWEKCLSMGTKMTCTGMFIAALFLRVPKWKQPKSLSSRKWINCGIQNGILYRSNCETQWHGGISQASVGQLLSRVCLFVTSWAAVHQAPLCMGFSRQEYWSGLPCPPPGDLPDSGIEPAPPALQVDSFTTEPSGEPFIGIVLSKRNWTQKRMNEKKKEKRTEGKKERRKEIKKKRKILFDSMYMKFDIREFYGDEVRTQPGSSPYLRLWTSVRHIVIPHYFAPCVSGLGA